MYCRKRQSRLFTTKPSITNITLTNSGNDDAFIVKYNTSGTPQWSTRIAGTGTEWIYSVSNDSNGNVYVTGQYSSSPLTIYNSDGSTFGTLTNSGSNDVFVAKYNTSGTAQWATRIAGTGSDNPRGIITDSNGNVYVTGAYASTPATIYNSDGSTFGTLTNSGSNDVFIVKYNTSGTVQWTTKIAAAGAEAGFGISADSNGNIYVTGIYASTPVTIYNSDTTTFGTLTNSGSNDIFIVKYNTSGTAQWTTRISGANIELAVYISADSNGNVYVTGRYESRTLSIYNSDGTTFGTLASSKAAGSGGYDTYLVKYNTTGTVQWATRIAGEGGGDSKFVCTNDSDGNVYIAGYFSTTITNSIGSIFTMYNSDGSTFATLTSPDVYAIGILAKYNTSGIGQWIAKTDGMRAVLNEGVTIDSTGNICVTGRYTDTTTIYNSDGSTFGTLPIYGATYDTLVIKYNPSGTAQWATRIAGTLADTGLCISNDSNGNIYVAGYYASKPLIIY